MINTSKAGKNIAMDDMTEEQKNKYIALYNDKKFCDVDLIAANDIKAISAHRIVLASVCEHFSKLFNEQPNAKEFIIEDVDGDILEAIVRFCYTHEILLTDENNEKALKAASFLQFDKLLQACSIFIAEKLTAKNCFAYSSLARKYNSDQLMEKVKIFSGENYHEIAKTDEFLKASKDQMNDLLSVENLDVETEKDVLDGLKRWMNYDMENRKDAMSELLLKINLTALNNEQLFREVVNWVGHDCNLQKILMDVLKFKAIKEASPQVEQMMAIPRKSFNALFVRGIANVSTNEDYLNVSYKVEEIDPSADNLLQLISVKEQSYRLPSFSYNFESCRAIYADDEVFIIGKELICYNVPNNKWEDIKMDLNGIQAVAMCNWQNTIYIFTADKINTSNLKVNKLDESRSSVVELSTDYVHGNYYQIIFDAVPLNDAIYLAVRNEDLAKNFVLRYMPLTEEWTKVTPTKSITNNCKLVNFNGQLYAFGNHNLVECYDSMENDWRTISIESVEDKILEAAFVFSSKIAVLYRINSVTFDLEIFNPKNLTWLKKFSFPRLQDEMVGYIGVFPKKL